MGKGIRFEITLPKGWYRFGPVPESPWDPPAALDGKKSEI